MKLDAIDHDLLELLQSNGRITISELSKQLHLSRPSINERLGKLTDKGIIEGYKAIVSPEALGKEINFMMEVKNLKIPCKQFEGYLTDMNEILLCHRVTGENSYIIKAAVEDMSALEGLVDQLIPYAQINSSIIISTPIKREIIL